jgi:hypothetical protein
MTSEEFCETYATPALRQRYGAGMDWSDPHEVFWVAAYQAPNCALVVLSDHFLSISGVSQSWSSSVSLAMYAIEASRRGEPSMPMRP